MKLAPNFVSSELDRGVVSQTSNPSPSTTLPFPIRGNAEICWLKPWIWMLYFDFPVKVMAQQIRGAGVDTICHSGGQVRFGCRSYHIN